METDAQMGMPLPVNQAEEYDLHDEDDYEEDEEEDDIPKLKRALANERAAPEILRYEEQVIYFVRLSHSVCAVLPLFLTFILHIALFCADC